MEGISGAAFSATATTPTTSAATSARASIIPLKKCFIVFNSLR